MRGLLELIDRRLESEARVVRLDIPLTDGKTLAWIYQRGEVLGRRDDNEAAHLSVLLAEDDIAQLAIAGACINSRGAASRADLHRAAIIFTFPALPNLSARRARRRRICGASG